MYESTEADESDEEEEDDVKERCATAGRRRRRCALDAASLVSSASSRSSRGSWDSLVGSDLDQSHLQQNPYSTSRYFNFLIFNSFNFNFKIQLEN